MRNLPRPKPPPNLRTSEFASMPGAPRPWPRARRRWICKACGTPGSRRRFPRAWQARLVLRSRNLIQRWSGCIERNRPGAFANVCLEFIPGQVVSVRFCPCRSAIWPPWRVGQRAKNGHYWNTNAHTPLSEAKTLKKRRMSRAGFSAFPAPLPPYIVPNVSWQPPQLRPGPAETRKG